MSSVDDPEKHLLGNLLEDDPGSTPSSIHGNAPSERNASSSSISPAIPQLSGIGPIMRPIPNSSMSNAWPEPPPPYTPRVDSWDPIMSNVNTALFSTSIQPVNFTSLPDPKENSAQGSDFLGTFNVSGNSSPMSPSTPTRSPQHTSPHVHHYHWLHHQHTHTHSVQVQNHYFGSPPPGLEAFGPRAGTSAVSAPATPSQSTPQFESATTPRWDYAGLENCKKSSVSFSDWKKENMSQTSPQSTVASESSVSVGSTKKEDQKLSPTHPPLSPSEVVEVAKEKKNISRSYAEHLSKSNTASASTMKGTPIGAEKKQKQELAKKLSSQVLTQHVVTRIQVKDQPHSAPVVSKMPFSYRDVAARVETSSTINPSNHQGETNQERKDTVSKDAKSSDAMSVKSKANDSGNESITSQKTDQSRKSRADNEFQKINNRKNKKEKNSNVVAAPLIYEGVHPVDASSRYDVLKNLESPTQQRNGKKNANNRPPQIQEIFPSRSSSPADDVDSDEEEEEEIQRTRSASNHNQMNGNNHVKKDQKKQRVVVNNQRRRKGKKTEPTWFDNFCVKLMEFICFVCGNVYYGIEWTMKLIVEVCQRTYDVSVTSSRSLAVGMWRGFWTILVTVVYLFLLLLIAIKKVIVNCLTFINVMGGEEFVELKDMDWGCRKEIPIPTNASEYADRLSRETIRDAYSVLGLKSDCSDDDIKRNYKRLAALVSPDKCNIDAVDDVYELVNLSFACIGFPEARENYIIQFTEINQAHIKLITCWTKMAKAIEESRNTIFCDCNKSHLRIRTTVNPSQARYCRKCDTYHPAKQNDIWAEKRTLSFCYTYYTCTDNVVYDISEWATCESQRALLKNLRAHTHNVQYRLLPPMNSDYDASFLNQAISQSSADTRYMNELSEEYPSLFRQRSLAHISFKNCEPREEDRSRRAANRRQKRWR